MGLLPSTARSNRTGAGYDNKVVFTKSLVANLPQERDWGYWWVPQCLTKES